MIPAAASLLRKVASEGIGYSVVELNDVRHVFAAAVPRSGTTLEEQTKDALRTIEAVIDKEGTRGSIVHQAVFLADDASMRSCRQLIHDFYREELPATAYIRQRPCGDKLLAIEALGVGQGQKDVRINRISEHLVIASHNDLSWIHCAQVLPRCHAGSVYDRSHSAFAAMRSLLAQANVRFDQIIRTWLYLGDIVGMEGPVQRYKELNRARTDFFEGIDFLADRLPPTPERGSRGCHAHVRVSMPTQTWGCHAHVRVSMPTRTWAWHPVRIPPVPASAPTAAIS